MDVRVYSEMAELARRIREGSPVAEEELVLRFRDRIYLFAEVWTRDAETARDLAQETLMTVISSLRAGRLQEPERLAGYVLGVAWNITRGWLRGARRRVRGLDEAFPSPDPGPEENSADLERHDLADRAIACLGEEDRHILALSVLEGLSPAEVARRLGLTPEAVRQRKSRALARAWHQLQKLSRT